MRHLPPQRDGKRWRAVRHPKVLIADIVDDAISSVLYAVDDGLLKISFSASSGKVVDLNSESLGELAGWYTGSDGWAARCIRRNGSWIM
jgi:hypothetical protein